MKLQKRLAILACLVAIPFVIAGVTAWVEGRAHSYHGPYGIEADQFGYIVFSWGSPLTLIVLKSHAYVGRNLQTTDDWWAIPLIVILFFLQWVVWSQVLALCARGIVKLTKRKTRTPSYS
jgi:hypothetical protein